MNKEVRLYTLPDGANFKIKNGEEWQHFKKTDTVINGRVHCFWSDRNSIAQIPRVELVFPS